MAFPVDDFCSDIFVFVLSSQNLSEVGLLLARFQDTEKSQRLGTGFLQGTAIPWEEGWILKFETGSI